MERRTSSIASRSPAVISWAGVAVSGGRGGSVTLIHVGGRGTAVRGEGGQVAGTEREPTEVRISKAALGAFAAAPSVRTVAMRTWPDGIEWMYPVGT